MPVLFVFLIKVNIALLLFCAGYYLVLRPLTFYTLNRVYLLAAILFASIYPQINLSAFAQRHQELAKPVLNWQLPAQNLVKPLTEPAYWHWAEVIFWLGAYVLAIRLAVQLFSLYRLYKSSKPAIINSHQVRLMDKDAAPFSFWRSIYVNPAKHEPADLKAILLHEQVHVNEWHTLDILLAELSSIFYWFNPGIWLMKKAIRENIEFITDRKILNNGIDSKTYQYSLVSVSFNNQQPGIVNHFNISTIKKRIIMMNSKRSSKLKLTWYAFLVPAVVALLLIFSISKADFAKPIRVKLANAVKPLTTVVSTGAIPDPVGKVAFSKPKKNNHQVTKSLPASKLDTIKKALVIDRNNDNDSVVYYINGIKGGLKGIDPDNIAEMKILKGDHASAYIGKDAAKNTSVISIITKDSPEGKRFEKLSGQYKSLKQSNDVVIAGYNVNAQPNVNLAKTYLKAYNLATSTNIATNVNIDQPNKNSAGTITRSKLTFTYPHTVIVDDSSASVSVSSNAGGKVTGIATSNGVITATNAGVSGSFTNYYNIKGVSLLTSKGASPLLMINGKEASEAEVKKLSPDKIESISVVPGGGARTAKYGSKAKEGVILFTTKK